MKGEKLTIQGDGTNTRHFLYDSDAADAFDTILHKGSIGEIYNVESDDEIAIHEVASRVLSFLGHDSVGDFESYVKWIPDRPFNDSRYNVDGSKLRKLGWRQKTDFLSGLALTVQWYQRNLDSWWAAPSNDSKLTDLTIISCKAGC